MPDITAATTGERLAEIEELTACVGCGHQSVYTRNDALRYLLAEVRRLSEENGRLRERIEAAMNEAVTVVLESGCPVSVVPAHALRDILGVEPQRDDVAVLRARLSSGVPGEAEKK